MGEGAPLVDPLVWRADKQTTTTDPAYSELSTARPPRLETIVVDTPLCDRPTDTSPLVSIPQGP